MEDEYTYKRRAVVKSLGEGERGKKGEKNCNFELKEVACFI